jgi:quercetin dioxygenase-like cupin family protein
MSVKHISSVEEKVVASAQATTIQVLISAQEGPHFAMRRFVMQPGGGMPLHTNTVEHEQYVLRGQAHIGINGEECDVKAGDVIFVPAGAPHFYQNTGSEPYEFLCIVPNQKDEVTIVSRPSC